MPMHKRESLIYTIMMCFTMVLWMSIYNVTLHMGILNMETIKEACVRSGAWSALLIIWLTNIPKNFIMALPFQLIVAGPLVRKVFRTAFPVGTILAE